MLTGRDKGTSTAGARRNVPGDAWPPAYTGRVHAGDGHLWGELRHGRQAAHRSAQDRRLQSVPADLDRTPGGSGDPDEVAGRLDPPADDPRPALRHARRARRALYEGVGHRAARQHVLRLDHAHRRRRHRGRDRLAAVRCAGDRGALRRSDLRRRGRHRRVSDRVRARGRERGRGRREVQGLPRSGNTGGLRRRELKEAPMRRWVALTHAVGAAVTGCGNGAHKPIRLMPRAAAERAEQLGIESPADVLAMNDAIASRYGEPVPGRLAAGIRQRKRLSTKKKHKATPGSRGQWTAVGNTPLIDDDPTYPAANGDGFGKLAGRVSDFAYNPSTKAVYATVAQGGVWKTTDLGGHWAPIGDKLPIGSTSGIAWTTAGGGTLIVSTGDHAFSNDYPGVGVYWTTNEGKTWHRARGVPSGLLSFRGAVGPGHAALASVAPSGGPVGSTDAGRSFANVKLPTGDCAGKSVKKPNCFFANVVTDVAVQPKDDFGNKGGAVIAAVGWRAGQQPNFAGKPESPNNGVYRSDDGTPGSFKAVTGTGFPDATIAGRTEFGVTHGPGQNSNYLYAVVQNTKLFAEQAGGESDIPLVGTPSVLEGIFVSPDFGKTWTEMESRNEFFNPANGSALSQLTAAGIGPGYQTTYNEWMQVDPTRQAGGVPTRVLLGMEEVWQTLSTQTPQSGHSQFQSFGMYTANGGLCLVEPEACGAVQQAKQDLTTTHPDQHGAILLPDAGG